MTIYILVHANRGIISQATPYLNRNRAEEDYSKLMEDYNEEYDDIQLLEEDLRV